MKLTLSSPDFSILMKLENVVKSLQPEIKLENLNSYLVYNNSKNTLELIIKGPMAYAKLPIPATIDKDFTDKNLGLMVYSGNITHLLSYYTSEDIKDLILSIEVDNDTSKFTLKSKRDTIDFAHLVPTESELLEIIELSDKLDDTTISNPINLSMDGKKNFALSLDSCLNFIEDDIRNNGIAIYADRLIASDNRHVFINKLKDWIGTDINNCIAIHKRIAKILIDIINKDNNVNFSISDLVTVQSESLGFKCIINNKIAVIAPPSEDNLKCIGPTKKISTFNTQDLKDIVAFFQGFYSSKVEFRTLMLTIQDSGVMFTLRNTGVSGYNSSNIERFKECSIEDKSTVGVTAVLLLDSIKEFISNRDKSDAIDLYMDSEHQAAKLDCVKEVIYLAKIPN